VRVRDVADRRLFRIRRFLHGAAGRHLVQHCAPVRAKRVRSGTIERSERRGRYQSGPGAACEFASQHLAGPAPHDWVWPADGAQTAAFGQKKGIEIAGGSGQTVRAANDGKVSFVGGGIRGYGNLVIVKHSGNLLSVYAHNKTVVVKEGQTVVKGQKIAEMGDSDSNTVKLYFEIRRNGKPVDPAGYLPTR
jgi:murein DD-endopeptidase MepM/ murein hydrolase activator NlpD